MATSQFTQSIAVRSRHLVNVHVMRDVYCQNHTKLLYVDNRLAKLQLTNRKSQIVRFFEKKMFITAYDKGDGISTSKLKRSNVKVKILQSGYHDTIRYEMLF